jgi:NSS family neurotransmitter:Na+ symporter
LCNEALLAGLAIFPAVFALGFDPGEGAGLAFITLPGAFAKMPFGQFFSALFVIFSFGVAASGKEFVEGAKNPNAFLVKIYPFAIKFIAPVAIALILLNAII